MTYMDNTQRAEFYFMEKLPGHLQDNLFIVISILLLQYCIWEEKLKKKSHLLEL
jgi:hypothetical protein